MIFLSLGLYKGKKKNNFIEQLEKLGFKSGFNSDGSIYLWNPDLKIEFLTCEKGSGVERSIKIKNLGIKVMPLLEEDARRLSLALQIEE